MLDKTGIFHNVFAKSFFLYLKQTKFKTSNIKMLNLRDLHKDTPNDLLLFFFPKCDCMHTLDKINSLL